MDGFLAEVKMFAGNYAPENWMFCWGQVLSIQQYSALYALVGTQFGGDGVNNFALPDLRGKVPVCSGQGTGLTMRTQGQYGGLENSTIAVNNLPPHNHMITNQSTTQNNLTVSGTANIKCSDSVGSLGSPKNNYLAANRNANNFTSTVTTDTMNASAVDLNVAIQGNVNVQVQSNCANTGIGQAMDNMQPWLCMNYIICVAGIWPPRP